MTGEINKIIKTISCFLGKVAAFLPGLAETGRLSASACWEPVIFKGDLF